MIRRGQVPAHLREDAEGFGMIGLCHAAKKFDPSRKVRFGTFAALRIRGAIRDGLREIDHLTRNHRAAIKRGEAADVRLGSLAFVVGRNDDGAATTLGDLVGRNDPAPRDPGFWRAATKGLVPLERDALLFYFRDGLTMGSVGARLGLSESRISQVLSEAIRRLRSSTTLAGRLAIDGR